MNKSIWAFAAFGVLSIASGSAWAAGEIILNDAPLLPGSLHAQSVSNSPTVYKIKKVTTSIPTPPGGALVPPAAISTVELEPSHTQGQQQLPIYLFGALGEQKKFDFYYDAGKEPDTYLLHVVLDALAQAKGFSDKGLDYVKVKLTYEKTYATAGSARKGLFETTLRYNLEDDNVKGEAFLNKAFRSQYPQRHPFKTKLGVFFNPFLDDEDYLSRSLATAEINGANLKLKSITIFAPGVSDQLWLTLLSSFAGEAFKSALSGATAGASAGATK